MDAVTEIEADLRSRAKAGRAEKEKAYLKSALAHLGVPVPEIRKVARAHGEERSLEQARALADALWARPVHELRATAVELLDRRALTLEDLPRLERWLREAKTWALVDPIAIALVGGVVERHGAGDALDRWAEDDDFWIRRAAMLALLRPLRRGDGDFERFGRYADAMLEEKEFFIRKAIGWVLRETGKKRPERVEAWLEPRAQRASGVTMREAVKPLGEDAREALMRRYRDARAS